MYRHGGEISYEGVFPLMNSVLQPRILPGQDLYPQNYTIYVDGEEKFEVTLDVDFCFYSYSFHSRIVLFSDISII